jgi:hypothetical protein
MKEATSVESAGLTQSSRNLENTEKVSSMALLLPS